ncbi:hypothetical protein [Candidatus Leptofilum sp.]|uniref:hypothetical protein n=1 Tax=Candidatus Leptofilum sp. TaxID=3241576 RepID=UPI003B59CCB1
MFDQLPDLLALLNDILEAVIVIFGSAVVLYNLGRSLRDPVMRAFCGLIIFVVVAYLAELLVSRTIVSASVEGFLRFQWIGIALVPAAQFHLSSTLLSTTGALPNRRRFLVPLGYVVGLVFLGLALFTDFLVTNPVSNPLASLAHLEAGPIFPVFAAYFWLMTASSIYNVWRARQRCITRTTRQRMTSTLLTYLAAPLGVFPYLLVISNAGTGQAVIPLWLWPIIILGNLVVGLMFGVLTAHLAYFGTASPDRVVRVRLFKFMARVPLAGSIVLLVYVLVSRNSPILGLPAETALGFSLVATVMLVEWAIHAYKRPLERLFQLNNDPDVRTIQRLSERLLTTRDLQQFLESILAATCEALRTPTSFVAAITPEGPQLEAVVGPLDEPGEIFQDADWRQLAQTAEPSNGNSGDALEAVGEFFVWRNYWIRPLRSRQHELVLGILGIRARSDEPDLSEEEDEIFGRLLNQAAQALEDRILQQEVFAIVEGLLPQIIAIQQRRSEATFGGLPVLAQKSPASSPVVSDPDFNMMVRDALTHYWGGPKLTTSPLMRLRIVQDAMAQHENNPTKALRAILNNAIELQKPEGERNMTTAEWILYNILELKFVQGQRVRDVARRLAMSESDLYRKQRVAIENVARAIGTMELASQDGASDEQ